MKFIKLLEIHVEEDVVINKGHVLVNLAEVRKIIKERDSLGNHCSRISYAGLTKEHDIRVRETPEEIATRYSGAPDMSKQIANEDFQPRQIKLPATPKVQEQPFEMQTNHEVRLK